MVASRCRARPERISPVEVVLVGRGLARLDLERLDEPLRFAVGARPVGPDAECLISSSGMTVACRGT